MAKKPTPPAVLPDAGADPTPPAVLPDVALPEVAVLAYPFAFWDDDNALRQWSAGTVVTDPDELRLLIDRGALFEGS